MNDLTMHFVFYLTDVLHYHWIIIIASQTNMWSYEQFLGPPLLQFLGVGTSVDLARNRAWG